SLVLVGLAVAVAFTNADRLLRNVERIDEPAGREHIQGALLQGVESVDRAAGFDVVAHVVKAGEQAPAFGEAIGADAEAHIVHAGALRLEAGVGGPEEARLSYIEPGAKPDVGGETDERRHRDIDRSM